MNIYELDPTKDKRWDSFLQSHPEASVFHTRTWLQALQQTYNYQPVVFTTAPPGHLLTNGVLFCRISNWFDRQRMVSLPFSDHCVPLVEDPDQLTLVLAALREKFDCDKWSSIEVRTTESTVPGQTSFSRGKRFFLHKLDIRQGLEEIFRNFHKDCVQRKIRRAVREKLTYEEGRSESLLAKFYDLLLMTRRRHGLPAQPAEWFRNIIACVGDTAKIRVASKDGRPIASILTLRYKNALIYKYGCSDRRFSNLGGTQLLLWKAIQEAKNNNIAEIDMGRSDCDNPGLVVFKERWGAERTTLVYLQHPMSSARSLSEATHACIGKYIWSHAPRSVLAAAGRALYKYVG